MTQTIPIINGLLSKVSPRDMVAAIENRFLDGSLQPDNSEKLQATTNFVLRTLKSLEEMMCKSGIELSPIAIRISLHDMHSVWISFRWPTGKAAGLCGVLFADLDFLEWHNSLSLTVRDHTAEPLIPNGDDRLELAAVTGDLIIPPSQSNG